MDFFSLISKVLFAIHQDLHYFFNYFFEMSYYEFFTHTSGDSIYIT